MPLFRACARLLSTILDRISSLDDSESLRLRKRLVIVVCIGGVLSLIISSSVYFSLGLWRQGGALALHALLMGMSVMIYLRIRRGFERFLTVQLFFVLLDTLMTARIIGFQAGQTMWMILLPLGALIGIPRHTWYWFAAMLTVPIVAAAVEVRRRELEQLSPDVQPLLVGLNMLLIFTFVFLMLRRFIADREELYALLNAEQARSEALLLNVLPPEIAARLKRETQVIADHHEQASILFADVADFTPLSAGVDPAALVELLNDLFSSFDELVERYGLEKIKTIGDAYMVAAGVPTPRPDHAHALAALALEMRAAVKGRSFGGRLLALRIGIHSGPVVAGVIGRKRFIYDLWGDTVNTASRMESHGLPGEIQLTEATHALIAADFRCEPRGPIPIKGKGEMQVWLLRAPHPQPLSTRVVERGEKESPLPRAGEG